jgi:GTPase involved in cell partitioning and DNA repair
MECEEIKRLRDQLVEKEAIIGDLTEKFLKLCDSFEGLGVVDFRFRPRMDREVYTAQKGLEARKRRLEIMEGKDLRMIVPVSSVQTDPTKSIKQITEDKMLVALSESGGRILRSKLYYKMHGDRVGLEEFNKALKNLGEAKKIVITSEPSITNMGRHKEVIQDIRELNL